MIAQLSENFGIALLFWLAVTIMATRLLVVIIDLGAIDAFFSWCSSIAEDPKPKPKPKQVSNNTKTHRQMVESAKTGRYEVVKYKDRPRVSRNSKPRVRPVVTFESEPQFILNDTSKPKPVNKNAPRFPEFITQVSNGLHGLGVSSTEAKKIASSTYCQNRHKNATDLLNDCLKKL